MRMYAFPGFCGGLHDSYILQNSQLFLDHKAGIWKWFCEPEYHLVGNCAYPLLSYLLKPFPERDNMSQAKKLYNKSLSGCRHTIECAFGLLKNKWKILVHPFTHDTEKTTLIACACCVLHNFCIVHGGTADVQDFLPLPPQLKNRKGVNVKDGQERRDPTSEEYVFSTSMAQKWQDIGLEGKEKESRILKKFEKC